MTVAVCPECGFPVPLGPVGSIQVWGNGGMNAAIGCPRCRTVFDAAPIDGTYGDVGGQLTLVQALVERIYAEGENFDRVELANEIERVDSRLAPLARWVREHQDLVISSVLAIVLFVLGQWLQSTPEPGLNPEQVEHIIERVTQNDAERLHDPDHEPAQSEAGVDETVSESEGGLRGGGGSHRHQ